MVGLWYGVGVIVGFGVGVSVEALLTVLEVTGLQAENSKTRHTNPEIHRITFSARSMQTPPNQTAKAMKRPLFYFI